MIYLAYVEYYDEINYDENEDKIIFTHNGDFTDAMRTIEDYYGSSIRAIHLLEPIGDAEVITINKEIENAIKDISENGF